MVAIDSMKLRFDVKDVEIVNPELSRLWGECSVSDDGEIEVSAEEFKQKALTIRHNGKTTRYQLVKRRVNQFETRESLVIMVNAKILESHYFKGIWTDTLDLLYQSIIAQEVIRIPFEKFVQADVTDCDIKKDFPVKDAEAQRKIVEVYKELSKPSKRKDQGYFSHCTEKNIGIEWQTRTTATTSKPFFKVYAKDLELKYKSWHFAMMYLDQVEPIMRMEGTIKNRAHFRYLFGLDDWQQFRLCDIVGMPNVRMERAITDMHLQHISLEASISIDKAQRMGLSEVLATTLLSHLKSLELAKLHATAYARDRSQAYLVREKLTYCWNAFIPDGMKADLKGLDDMLDFTINAREKEERFNQIKEGL